MSTEVHELRTAAAPCIARPIAVPVSVHVSNGVAADIRGRICMAEALLAYWRGREYE